MRALSAHALAFEIGRRELLGEQPPEAPDVAVDVAPAQLEPRRVAARVRTPRRVHEELDRARCALPRVQPPTLQVVDHLVARTALDVQEPRRVDRHSAQRVAELAHGSRRLFVVGDADAGEDARGNGVRLLAERHLERDHRDALAHDRLRRADEEDRLLEIAVAVDEQRLLPRVLRVVARVRLVRDEQRQEERVDRPIRVEHDAAPTAAEVVVERRPRLVRDLLEVERLVIRKPDERLGSRT